MSSTQLQKFVVSFYLILLSTQLVAIEGMNISPVKVAGMTLSPLFYIFLINKFNRDIKVFIYAGMYLTMIVCCSLLASQHVVWERFIYRSLFLCSFIVVYKIVYSGNLELEFFLKLFIFTLCAYGIIFLIQHICFFVGIKELAVINLTGAMTMGGGLKANGLAIEPSHASRILSFIYWGIIVLTEVKEGKELTLVEHFKTNPWSTLAFWGSMLSMGSATAMLGAIIIFIHFAKKYIWLYLVSAFAVIILLNVDINIEAIERIKAVINAFLSDDVVNTLKETESSGGSRIAPMINTITDTDLFAKETWIGQGSDHIRSHLAMFTTQKIGDINDFGLLSYTLSLFFVFKCCLRKFFCLETLLFAILLGFSIGSLYTCWSAMIVCTIIRYFSKDKQ